MSDNLRQRAGDQPLPTPSDRPSIQSMVRADLDAREQLGVSRYGTALQAHNGRDMLRDAYEEAMDLTVYLRGVIEERDQPAVSAPVSTEDADLSERVARALADRDHGIHIVGAFDTECAEDERDHYRAMAAVALTVVRPLLDAKDRDHAREIASLQRMADYCRAKDSAEVERLREHIQRTQPWHPFGYRTTEEWRQSSDTAEADYKAWLAGQDGDRERRRAMPEISTRTGYRRDHYPRTDGTACPDAGDCDRVWHGLGGPEVGDTCECCGVTVTLSDAQAPTGQDGGDRG